MSGRNVTASSSSSSSSLPPTGMAGRNGKQDKHGGRWQNGVRGRAQAWLTGRHNLAPPQQAELTCRPSSLETQVKFQQVGAGGAGQAPVRGQAQQGPGKASNAQALSSPFLPPLLPPNNNNNTTTAREGGGRQQAGRQGQAFPQAAASLNCIFVLDTYERVEKRR